MLKFCKKHGFADVILSNVKVKVINDIMDEIQKHRNELKKFNVDIQVLIAQRVQAMLLGYHIGYGEACKMVNAPGYQQEKEILCKTANNLANEIIKKKSR